MQPAPATRPATPDDCRKEAWKNSGFCLSQLWLALVPSLPPIIPHWAASLYFLAMALISAKSAVRWFFLRRYLGQTIIYFIGPRGRTLWQRTVTYDIPQVMAKPKDPPPASTIITVGWTFATAIMLVFAVSAFSQVPKESIWVARLYSAIAIALFISTVINWKRVGQQRRRRTLSRTRNTSS